MKVEKEVKDWMEKKQVESKVKKKVELQRKKTEQVKIIWKTEQNMF